MFRTVGDQASLWESVLPEELRRLPEELARVDALLDDSAFFCPFVPFFDPRMGRPSIPMETYLRLMFLKFRYRLGYESLCREVTDSITWRRFCRIPLEGSVPHPTTLMKLTTRCGEDAVAGLNEALLAKAASEKLLRTNKVRADTTVVEGDVGYPTDTGLLAKAVGSMARTVARIKAADAGSAPLGGSSGAAELAPGPHRPGAGSLDPGGHRAAGTRRRRVSVVAAVGVQVRNAGPRSGATRHAGAAVGRGVASHPVLGVSSRQCRPGAGSRGGGLRAAGGVAGAAGVAARGSGGGGADIVAWSRGMDRGRDHTTRVR